MLSKLLEKQIQPERNYKFVGQISQVFSCYMDLYVNYFKEFTQNKVKIILGSESYDPTLIHCMSSIFSIFEQNFTELKDITVGKTLLDIYKTSWVTGINSILKHLEEKSKPKKKTLKNDSYNMFIQILKMLDHTKTELESFEKLIKSCIIDEYKPKISFKPQQIRAYKLSKFVFGRIVQSILYSIKPHLKRVSTCKWNESKKLDRESPFINNIKTLIVNESKYLFKHLSLEYSKIYLRIISKLFIDQYFDSILKCSLINGDGISQFKIDIDFLKKVFNNLILEHNDGKYEEFVCLGWDKIELITKILLLPNTSSKLAQELYIKTFGKNSTKDQFAKIIALRGWKINEKENQILKRIKRVMSV
jgi:hypothetical protein